MPTTPPQRPSQTASGRHSAQWLRPGSYPLTPVIAPPSLALWRHCGNLRRTMRTCAALLPPLCCQLLVLSMYFPLRRNPRTAWARPSGAVRTLTRSRPPSAGPSEHRHVERRGRYPLQRPPRRPLELPGCRCDLRKTKDDAKDGRHPRRLTL